MRRWTDLYCVPLEFRASYPLAGHFVSWCGRNLGAILLLGASRARTRAHALSRCGLARTFPCLYTHTQNTHTHTHTLTHTHTHTRARARACVPLLAWRRRAGPPSQRRRFSWPRSRRCWRRALARRQPVRRAPTARRAPRLPPLARAAPRTRGPSAARRPVRQRARRARPLYRRHWAVRRPTRTTGPSTALPFTYPARRPRALRPSRRPR